MFDTASPSNNAAQAMDCASAAAERPASPVDHWLVAVAGGNQAAFARLYDATSGKLLAQAMAMLRRRDAAEDALQDGFVRIWANPHRYDPARGPALPWMARVMRNVILDRLRRERLVSRYHVDGEGIAEPAAAEVPVADRIDLARGLATLSPDQRRAIVNVVVLGWTHEESGQHEGVPVPTSKARVQRGLRRLRASY
jgi:RNA polymerase sigma-70 factor (ECF subfamily)